MKGWREVELRQIATVVDSLHRTPKYVETGYSMVRVTDIKKGYLNLSNTLKVDKETYKEFSKKHIPMKGDILFARVGSYGTTCLVVSDEKFCLGQNTAFIIPHEDSHYLYYYLNSPLGRSEIEARVAGSTQSTISLKSINSFIIRIPPLPEQEAIASVLSSLDDKIDLLHRQNATLEAMAETLFRQWFVVEAKDGWEEGTLEDEFIFVMGQSPKGSSFNEVGHGTPLFQGSTDFGFRFPTLRIYTTEPTRLAEKFDTLVSVRAPVGEQNMAPTLCCIGRGVAVFRYKKNEAFYTYTYYKMRSLLPELAVFNDEGTVFGSATKKDFAMLKISIPPIGDVTNFEKSISPVNKKIITNCYQIHTLEKLRDTLLPMLMSGKVRVEY